MSVYSWSGGLSKDAWAHDVLPEIEKVGGADEAAGEDSADVFAARCKGHALSDPATHRLLVLQEVIEYGSAWSAAIGYRGERQ